MQDIEVTNYITVIHDEGNDEIDPNWQFCCGDGIDFDGIIKFDNPEDAWDLAKALERTIKQVIADTQRSTAKMIGASLEKLIKGI